MGRKRKNKSWMAGPKPFCYYCDREFNDEKVLLVHQRTKHFTCPHCYKKLSSARGLVTHARQLHSVEIKTIPNSISGRESSSIDISAMNGVPPQVLAAHYGQLGPNDKRMRGPPPMGFHQGPPMGMPPMMPMRGMYPPPFHGYPPAQHAMYSHRPPYGGGFPPMHLQAAPPMQRPRGPPAAGTHMRPAPQQIPPQQLPPQQQVIRQQAPLPPDTKQTPSIAATKVQQRAASATEPRAFPSKPQASAPTTEATVSAAPAAAPLASNPLLRFVFKGEDGESMEERRARLPRYRRPGRQAAGLGGAAP